MTFCTVCDSDPTSLDKKLHSSYLTLLTKEPLIVMK